VIKLVCVLVKFEHVIATDWPMVCNLWSIAVGDSAGANAHSEYENCLEMMREPTNRDLPGLFWCLKYAGAIGRSVPSGKGADCKADRFYRNFNDHSEKSAKLRPFPINRLA
jgi:hypothetical protein